MTKPLFLLLAIALPAIAQAQGSCSSPGAAFGVLSYQCASCAVGTKPDGRNEFTFHTEPVVLQAREGGAFQSGDIIVSVDDKPITTRAGADLFTYPDSVSRVQFRRGRETITLTFTLTGTSASCSMRLKSADVIRGQATQSNVPYSMTVTNAPVVSGTGAKTGKFGFSLGCVPSCTRTKDEKGREFWRYDGHPTMQNITPGGPADRAGVKEGDLLLDVGEYSVLTPEGAQLLQRSDKMNVLTLTLRRADGQDAVYTLATKDAEKAFRSPVRCEGTTVGVVQNQTTATVDVLANGRMFGSARPGRSEFVLPTGTRYLSFQALTSAGTFGVRTGSRYARITYEIFCR